MNRKPEKGICLACLHFLITHEPGRPYGCRAFGFKSVQLPAAAVLENSGQTCRLFSSKRPQKKAKE